MLVKRIICSLGFAQTADRSQTELGVEEFMCIISCTPNKYSYIGIQRYRYIEIQRYRDIDETYNNHKKYHTIIYTHAQITFPLTALAIVGRIPHCREIISMLHHQVAQSQQAAHFFFSDPTHCSWIPNLATKSIFI